MILSMNLFQYSILLEKYGQKIPIMLNHRVYVIERRIEFIGQSPFNKIIGDPDKEIQILDITRQIIRKFIDAYFQFKDSFSNSC